MKFAVVLVCVVIFGKCSCLEFLNNNDLYLDKSRLLREQLLTIEDHHEVFRIWHEFHSKHLIYHPESEEGQARKSVFLQNLKKIKERNAVLTEYQLAPGPHSDLNQEEYRNIITHKNKSERDFYKGKSEHMLGHVMLDTKNIWENKHKIVAKALNPNYEDWSKYYGVTRNQGDCGSCWAFATVGSIEGRLSKLTGKYEQLSPKYLVDCSTKDTGCDGGSYDTAFEFALHNGLVYEKDYKYSPQKDTCTAKPQALTKLNRMIYCSNEDTEEQFHCNYGIAEKCKEFLQWSPLATAIDADSFDFQNYSSGIYSSSCKEPNHAVIIVEITEDYVKIRNSWGENWGLSGYIKVKRDKKNNFSCFTESECFAAINDE